MGSAAFFQPKPGDLLADRFRVERLIGSGGMGAVYEVTHVHTKHHRALKLLHPAAAQRREVVDRFLREASVAGRIGHPNIVEIVDAGWLPEGPPYVLMELLAGEDLAMAIERSGPLALPDAAAIVHKVASAVAAAHKVGIIHRDIKPANVFLVAAVEGARAGDRDVKLLDFGISKFAAEHTALLASTKDGGPLGTPLYMAPEQLEDSSRVDERSDVFALGLLLYEALAGKAPYKAESLGALFKAILGGERVPLGEVVPGLPEDVIELVEHALAIRREDRVRDASLFSIELSRWLPPSGPRSARTVQVRPVDAAPVAAAASDVSASALSSSAHEGGREVAPSSAAPVPVASAPSAVPAAASPPGTPSIQSAPTAPASRTSLFALAALSVVAVGVAWAIGFGGGGAAGSASAGANVASAPDDSARPRPPREIRVEPTGAESASSPAASVTVRASAAPSARQTSAAGPHPTLAPTARPRPTSEVASDLGEN